MISIDMIPQMYVERIVYKHGSGENVVKASIGFMEFVRDLKERGIKNIPALCIQGELNLIEKELSALL